MHTHSYSHKIWLEIPPLGIGSELDFIMAVLDMPKKLESVPKDELWTIYLVEDLMAVTEGARVEDPLGATWEGTAVSEKEQKIIVSTYVHTSS